jgi:uncharacterized protein
MTETRVVLRPLANPLPLGFFALASATLLLSGQQLSWFPKAESPQLALFLLAFVVPLQLLTAVLGYLAQDVVAATGMGVLAGTWATVGLVARDGPPGATSDVLGLVLVMSALALLAVAITAWPAKRVPALVIGTTALRFALTGGYQLTDRTAWATAAGTLGLVLCAIATYAAWALLVEDADVADPPLGRHGRAIETARPPGVREQL